MAFDSFLVFDNPGSGAKPLKGETRDEEFKDKAFEINSFDFGIENTLNIGSKGGGAGAGKATFNEFTVEKDTDKGSANLFLACCNGGHYGDVTLILRKAGGDSGASGVKYLNFSFKLVAIKSINWSGSDGDEACKETVVFEYGAIKVEYWPQKQDGSLESVVTQQWSRVINRDKFEV